MSDKQEQYNKAAQQARDLSKMLGRKPKTLEEAAEQETARIKSNLDRDRLVIQQAAILETAQDEIQTLRAQLDEKEAEIEALRSRVAQ